MSYSYVLVDDEGTTDTLPAYFVTVEDRAGTRHHAQVHAPDAAAAGRKVRAFLAGQKIVVRQVISAEPIAP